MTVDLLVTNIGQLATPAGRGPRRGRAMAAIDVTPDATIAISGDRIAWVGTRSEWSGRAARTIDANGNAVVPALIDPHTHAIWGGDRLDDFDARAAGVRYQEILARGGGIHRTIAATCDLDPAALAVLAAPRLAALTAGGAATIEIKSGYGFSADGERRSLDAIRLLTATAGARLLSTLLIHVPPREHDRRDDYVDMVCRELIPSVARDGLATAVDVFIEQEAFCADDARKIFAAAIEHGLRTKAHADQFHAIGGVAAAIASDTLSVDHLEAADDADINRLATSDTVAVLLPGVTLHLGIPAAPGRALIDAGAAVAVGTDLNPGSSPVFSPQLAMALAVRLNGLTPAEALTAATVNAAAAVGLDDTGSLRPGARADVLITRTADWRDLVYTLGANPIERVFIAGHEVVL